MTFEQFFALILFLLPLAYSPGPGNAYFAVHGARSGLMGVFPALVGYHLATLVASIAIGSGLALPFMRAPSVAIILTMLSSAYMFWLAWLSLAEWQASRPGGAPEATSGQSSFAGGAFLLVANPKAYLIMAMMFSAFRHPEGNLGFTTLISLVFTVNNFIAFALWAIAGRWLSRTLSDRAAQLVYAIAFAAVGVWLLAELAGYWKA